ncbi:MAG: hypothetical protein AAF907_03300 [Planctomycetota bacterium]
MSVAAPTVVTLACPKCGATLRLPGGADGRTNVRFLTCEHCGATARLKRSGDRVTAKRVKTLGRRVDGLRRTVSRMRLEEKLHELDDRWNRRRASLIVGWDERGEPIAPKRKGAIMLLAAGVGLAVWGAADSWIGGRFPFSFKLLAGVVLMAFAIRNWVRAERFRKGRADYLAERAELKRRGGEPSYSSSRSSRPPAAPANERPHDWPAGWPDR